MSTQMHPTLPRQLWSQRGRIAPMRRTLPSASNCSMGRASNTRTCSTSSHQYKVCPLANNWLRWKLIISQMIAGRCYRIMSSIRSKTYPIKFRKLKIMSQINAEHKNKFSELCLYICIKYLSLILNFLLTFIYFISTLIFYNRFQIWHDLTLWINNLSWYIERWPFGRLSSST